MEVFRWVRTDMGEVLIEKYTGEETRVEVPPEIDGFAVTEIGDYAFSGSSITHLELPRTVRRLGRYALYGCGTLEEVGFCEGLRDIGAGAFTGCHHIRRLRITVGEDETSALRDVLTEIPEELEVEYLRGSEKAVLMFPEYYEEGVENTPARIIEHHTHGSGLLYRNCFVSRRLRFREYDARFPYALGQERDAFLVRLVLGRLMYPYELADQDRQKYEDWLLDHMEQALKLCTQGRETEKISFLMNLRHSRIPSGMSDFSL